MPTAKLPTAAVNGTPTFFTDLITRIFTGEETTAPAGTPFQHLVPQNLESPIALHVSDDDDDATSDLNGTLLAGALAAYGRSYVNDEPYDPSIFDACCNIATLDNTSRSSPAQLRTAYQLLAALPVTSDAQRWVFLTAAARISEAHGGLRTAGSLTELPEERKRKRFEDVEHNPPRANQGRPRHQRIMIDLTDDVVIDLTNDVEPGPFTESYANNKRRKIHAIEYNSEAEHDKAQSDLIRRTRNVKSRYIDLPGIEALLDDADRAGKPYHIPEGAILSKNATREWQRRSYFRTIEGRQNEYHELSRPHPNDGGLPDGSGTTGAGDHDKRQLEGTHGLYGTHTNAAPTLRNDGGLPEGSGTAGTGEHDVRHWEGIHPDRAARLDGNKSSSDEEDDNVQQIEPATKKGRRKKKKKGEASTVQDLLKKHSKLNHGHILMLYNQAQSSGTPFERPKASLTKGARKLLRALIEQQETRESSLQSEPIDLVRDQEQFGNSDQGSRRRLTRSMFTKPEVAEADGVKLLNVDQVKAILAISQERGVPLELPEGAEVTKQAGRFIIDLERQNAARVAASQSHEAALEVINNLLGQGTRLRKSTLVDGLQAAKIRDALLCIPYDVVLDDEAEAFLCKSEVRGWIKFGSRHAIEARPSNDNDNDKPATISPFKLLARGSNRPGLAEAPLLNDKVMIDFNSSREQSPTTVVAAYPGGPPRARHVSSINARAKISHKPRDGDIVGANAPVLGADNKGRAMLEKMGWSMGMVLGKEGTGIATPIEHVVKNTRAGLGQMHAFTKTARSRSLPPADAPEGQPDQHSVPVIASPDDLPRVISQHAHSSPVLAQARRSPSIEYLETRALSEERPPRLAKLWRDLRAEKQDLEGAGGMSWQLHEGGNSRV